MDELIRAAALDYHRYPVPGKISVTPTKVLSNQRDLSLAYSPGVAAACDAIVDNPAEAVNLTAKGNLIGVITNGTAVLGLGNIGALAAKPVMEGKGVLFKKFAGIDVFDIEVNEPDPDRLIDLIAALEPTFGGINLEDIKAPECFYIEQKLRERMKIPVFHDDQHGTAIVVGAAVLNGLHLQGKDLTRVKVVTSGAGAAALACLDLLEMLGIPAANIWVTDIEGLVYEGRTVLMDPVKARYAKQTDARTLNDVIADADVFLGLSAGGVLKSEMVAKMAPCPLILALANPHPEILPADVRSVRDDAIIATGRSDYPNQVNNVLCFPFIFRGALDVGATTINNEMKLAAVQAIASLARAEQSEIVAAAYGEKVSGFGADYIIPRPFDPRLIVKIAPAVALAAMESGVATRSIADWDAYRSQLNNFVWHSGMLMKPVYAAAKKEPQRIIFAEGESELVLRAVRTVIDEGLAWPILIGRPEVIGRNVDHLGLHMNPGYDYEIVNPELDSRSEKVWSHYHDLMERRGMSIEDAQRYVRGSNTLLGALLLNIGHGDGLICGTEGVLRRHLKHVETVIGRRAGVSTYYTLNVLNLPGRTLFLADTNVNYDPTPDQVVEMTLLAAEEMRRFGVEPKVALLSHSSFGSADSPTAEKMRVALRMLHGRYPDLQVEGEMHGDSALDARLRLKIFPNAHMREDANLLIFPTLDAANIAFNLLKSAAGGGMTVGPILLGAARPVHVLTPSATVRRIINMTALTVVEAGQNR
ncbi:malic enzyme [Betaproteobacteria bacterium]|nr:malic enzyme [Betaproteobacteria bacterium]GHU03224.1 malic enzyme [Betaproteobacteria bacterium]GHU23373.1 malic enzyme [Betaproteobacteria bacterium]